MALSSDEFVERLRVTGLLAEPGIEQGVAQLAAEAPSSDAEQLANALVEQGRLTAYQAAVLCEGRAARLVLGKYIILDKLGEGGMGQVFKARHRYMDRVVALKTLPGTLADTPEAVARFQREARAAARLDHPNIVTAFDADECDGVPFLAMELVEGTDLALRVRQKGPLSVEQAVDAVRQAAEGLACAHTQGIIHRDIKPSNLLLDNQGTVKVLDLGLARLVQTAQESADQPMLTMTGHVTGTIDYMSPEQAEDMRQVDARSDLYSLGCTLWTLLTGRPIYPGESAAERLVRHLEAPIPSLRAARTEVPESLDRLFRRMVAKRPEDRPQSMAEVLEELAHPERVVVADRARFTLPGSRRTQLWAAIGVCVAILLLGLGMAALRHGPAVDLADVAEAQPARPAPPLPSPRSTLPKLAGIKRHGRSTWTFRWSLPTRSA